MASRSPAAAPSRLLLGVARPLPRHEHPAGAQQRRGVLGQHRQRGHRPGGHGVVGLAAAQRRRRAAHSSARAAIAAGVLDLRRAEPGARSPRTCGRATRSGRPALGQRHRQQAGPGSRRPQPTSAIRRGAAPSGLEPGEAVRHVRRAAPPPRVRRRRVGLGVEASAGARAAASAEGRSWRSASRRAFPVKRSVAAGGAGSGVTTSRRSGSSPSLWVSTSVRSRRYRCTILRSAAPHRLELDRAAEVAAPRPTARSATRCSAASRRSR